MTIDELHKRLKKELKGNRYYKVKRPFELLGFYYLDELEVGGLTLKKEDDSYVFYYDEPGRGMFLTDSFENESDACEEFYKKLFLG